MRLIPSTLFVALALAACSHAKDEQRSAATTLDPRYRILTPDLLAATPDTSVEWAVVQHVHWRIGDDYDKEREIVGHLPAGVRAVYTTWYLEAEVDNGGFNQYFFNSTGVLAQEALAGLRLVGAADHARLMEQALAAYQQERPRLEAARRAGTADAFRKTYDGSSFEPLDEQFYKLPDLAELRVRLIRNYPEYFFGP